MSNRSEPILSSYLHAKGAQLGLPISGNFELTARCNFSCPMCYVHLCKARQEQELTAQQWLSLAEQAKHRGMMFVLLTGGEPFLRKDFFEIYEGIKAMGLMVSINTNGSFLTGEIRRRLIENPPFRMNISLYGGCAETYRQMCGVDAFHQVVENIMALVHSGIDVRLNYSITPYNHGDMERIYRIAKELDLQIKASSYMYPPIRARNQGASFQRLSAEDSARYCLEWDKIRMSQEDFLAHARRFSACGERACPVEKIDGVNCRAGTTTFWLTWDGKMMPCGMMPGLVALPLQTGFAQAWESIRSKIRKIQLPDACKSCPKREPCSVCAAVCVSETGAFDGVPDYVCRRTDEFIRLMQNYIAEVEHAD